MTRVIEDLILTSGERIEVGSVEIRSDSEASSGSWKQKQPLLVMDENSFDLKHREHLDPDFSQ